MYRTENFEIVAPSKNIGNYGREDIVITNGRRMARTNSDVDLYERMEKAWNARFEDVVRNGKKLSSGPQYRLSRFREKNGKMLLGLGPTDYREFIGTNVEAGKDPEYMQMLVDRGKLRYGDPDSFFSNVLAVCSVVETSDNKIVAGLRSDMVAEYPRCWHTVGGHPNPIKYSGGEPDLFDSMSGEITRELGISADEINDMQVTGLMKNKRTRKPELLFQAKISAPFDKIREMRGYEKDEHFKFFGISGAEELIYFLNSNQKDFTFPINHGLSQEEAEKLKPKSLPDNTTNYLVPPGEASWILYLRSIGVDILKELPYVEAVNR